MIRAGRVAVFRASRPAYLTPEAVAKPSATAFFDLIARPPIMQPLRANPASTRTHPCPIGAMPALYRFPFIVSRRFLRCRQAVNP